MERNVKTFDIVSPLEAFQFATFLVRLARHSAQLQRLFERVKAEFYEEAQKTLKSDDFKNKKFVSWTKITQPVACSGASKSALSALPNDGAK